MDPFHLTPCFSVSVGFNSSRVHTQPLPNESVQSRGILPLLRLFVSSMMEIGTIYDIAAGI